jgi:hypothetical protein
VSLLHSPTRHWRNSVLLSRLLVGTQEIRARVPATTHSSADSNRTASGTHPASHTKRTMRYYHVLPWPCKADHSTLHSADVKMTGVISPILHTCYGVMLTSNTVISSPSTRVMYLSLFFGIVAFWVFTSCRYKSISTATLHVQNLSPSKKAKCDTRDE